MDQAVGQMRGSDEKLARSISNIKIRDQESGILILEFFLNYYPSAMLNLLVLLLRQTQFYNKPILIG